MEKVKLPLTETEIKFMELWTIVITKKYNISSDSIDQAASLINYKRTGTCSTCLRNDAAAINNVYRQLLPEYNLYLDVQKLKIEIEKQEEVRKVQEANEELYWDNEKEDFILKFKKNKK